MLKQGQVLSFVMRFNNSGDIAVNRHPYLIMHVMAEYIEVAQIDSLKGKEWKAFSKTNKVIYCQNETVIDKDSYIQLDNTYRIENFVELENYRRQIDVLNCFVEILQAYNEYHQTYQIDENKQVYIDKTEFFNMNS